MTLVEAAKQALFEIEHGLQFGNTVRAAKILRTAIEEAEKAEPAPAGNKEGYAMNDRELLELAAKAAGYPVIFHDDPKASPRWKKSAQVERIFWNPFTDDGDVWRLAAKLKITIEFDREMACVQLPNESYLWTSWGTGYEPDHKTPNEAIVWLAAEIGRAMP